MFKRVFCRDISVEHEYDRCVKIQVEAQRKMTETRSQNFTAIYRPSPWNLSKFVVTKHFG